MTDHAVVVIGGGPAGIMASYIAAKEGQRVYLLEKNNRLGRKMLIAGKGRCNLTNNVSSVDLVKNMVGNGTFLYGAFHDFSAIDVMEWFEEGGVPLKTERGQRVFPKSDQSKDIVNFMERQIRRLGVTIEFNAEVNDIMVKDGKICGVVLKDKIIDTNTVMIATGGASYPLTGSTGDGYRMAKALGHHIETPFPALVPLVVKEAYVKDLEGLSLRNALLTIKQEDKVIASEFGEMVFTDFGLSGPVVLTASRSCSRHFLSSPKEPLSLTINLKPGLTEEQLDLRLQRDFDNYPKRNYQTILEQLLPKKIIPVFVRLSNIDPWRKVHSFNRQDRKLILKLLREFPFTVVGTRPIEEAIVTAGGVFVKEINPKTMGSKLVEGLFFGGEVMDIDGVTGGFNIQAALSTGYRGGYGMSLYQNGLEQKGL